MKPPPLILGAALIFWGWRVDMLAIAAVAAGLLELSNGIKARWDFTDKEFNRLWDVCTVLFLVVAVFGVRAAVPALVATGVVIANLTFTLYSRELAAAALAERSA